MNMLTAEKLRELVHYEPATGIMRWKARRAGCRAGDIIGTPDKKNYLTIGLLRKRYFVHRLAWLYVHGEWPESELDHVNCDPTDNRLVNLRAATRVENCRNTRTSKRNHSGRKGVHFDHSRQKWMAFISVQGRFKNLGRFATFEEASARRIEAAKIHHGAFARA